MIIATAACFVGTDCIILCLSVLQHEQRHLLETGKADIPTASSLVPVLINIQLQFPLEPDSKNNSQTLLLTLKKNIKKY